jgi:mRNA interferase YafQ
MPVVRKLVPTKIFERSYKKYAGKNQSLKAAIDETLLKLQANAYDNSLKTHKLSGKLAAHLACSCGYDCRIVFIIEKSLTNPEEENIVLLDIGTHDDVY